MMLIDMGREQDVTLNDNECWNQKDFSEFASTLGANIAGVYQ